MDRSGSDHRILHRPELPPGVRLAEEGKVMPEPLTVTVENARLFFKNFSGKEGPYNREGDRNFCCELPEDVAEAMTRDGWNVRYSKPQDEGDEGSPYIQVTVRF